jgi:hypothetical protein
MGSRYHPSFYDPDTVASFKDAFHEIWDTVEGQTALRFTPADVSSMKANIAQNLLDVINQGRATSREELISEVLNRLGVSL